MRSRGTFSKPNSPGPRSGSDAAASTPTSSRNNISAEFRRRASDFRPKEEHPSSHVARPSSAPSNARASYSAEQKSDISVLSKKKKCSTSSRCSGGLLTTSLLGASPPSLTAGASTLQGHSSQKFGKTSLEKDVSRAVSFIVRMVAAVPPPPSFPDMTGMPMNPMATGIVCHSHPRFAGGSTQSLPVPLSTAQRSSAAQSLQAV